MSDKVQTKVYLPPDVKAMLDADPRSNSEIVESALITEFGGEKTSALQRRVEEKERRLSNLKGERNERDREIRELKDELSGMRQKLENAQEVREKQVREAVDKLTVKELQSVTEPIVATDRDVMESLADDLDMTAEELQTKAIEDYKANQ